MLWIYKKIYIDNLTDPRWSVHRKLLNPTFGHKVLLSFLPIFNNETGTLLKQLDTLVDDGEKDLIPLLQAFTIGIATRKFNSFFFFGE